MGNVDLTPFDDAPLFRKMAMGTWRTPSEGSVYAQLDIDMTRCQTFMAEYRARHEVKITPTHLVGRAIALAMKERPEINGMIRGSKIYLRKHVDLFFSVNLPPAEGDKVGKAELAGATVFAAEDMSVADIARALRKKAELVRAKKDPNLKASMSTMRYVPWSLMRAFLGMVSWLIYGLNLDLSALGLPRDPFGSVIITNIGGFGIDIAFAPLIPYSRVPLLLAIGAVQQKPYVVDGQVVPRPVMSVGVTFDHRFMDGVHAAQMARTFKRCFEDPETYFGDPPAEAARAEAAAG